MKYIDADKLITEIERRKKELFEIGGDTFENKWACGSLDSIKAFVISLQQEQLDVDLEKEIEEHVEGMPMSEFTHESEVDIHYDWARKEFRYFFGLGLNAGKRDNMTIKVNKNQMFDDFDDKLARYQISDASHTWGSRGTFEKVDVTVEQLLDYINKGYGIKINC